jgi:hypothetical protein
MWNTCNTLSLSLFLSFSFFSLYLFPFSLCLISSPHHVLIFLEQSSPHSQLQPLLCTLSCTPCVAWRAGNPAPRRSRSCPCRCAPPALFSARARCLHTSLRGCATCAHCHAAVPPSHPTGTPHAPLAARPRRRPFPRASARARTAMAMRGGH